MKELMLLAIGMGAGFAICGCLMFYVMAKINKSIGSKKNKWDETTVELMRERNRCDWLIEGHLRRIANYPPSE